jgi:hypothetical protein
LFFPAFLPTAIEEGVSAMKTIFSLRIILAFTLLIPLFALAQGETAVPFLLIPSSAEGNGMGGISASVSTDNAMSVIANPGELGLLSMKNLLTAGTYTEKTKWLPQLPSGPTYNTSAINVGLDLARVTAFPIPISVGLGYSRVYVDLGEFIANGPAGHEKSESFSVGIGFDYLIKLGVGLNVKLIDSKLIPDNAVVEPGAGKGNGSAVDYGMMLKVPITEIVSASLAEPLELPRKLAPLLDVTMGYARSNLGDEISYADPAQRDPLPRNATLGLSAEIGVVSKALSSDWKVLSSTWARQVEDVLVKRYPDEHFEYQGWFGDIKPFDNLILGKWGGNVVLRKGWQFEVGEIVSVRGGSFTSIGPVVYRTSGYSIRLSGLFKLLEALSPSSLASNWLLFVRDHIDIQFHSASYGESSSSMSETSFKGLNLVIR